VIPETSVGVAAAVGAFSAALFALFGVDYYSLLGGLVGAMLALGGAARMSRAASIAFVLLSMFVGAVLGNVVATYIGHPPRAVLILLCIVGGIVAQAFSAAVLTAAPAAMTTFISRWTNRAGGRE
jgi:hypothetical protein